MPGRTGAAATRGALRARGARTEAVPQPAPPAAPAPNGRRGPSALIAAGGAGGGGTRPAAARAGRARRCVGPTWRSGGGDGAWSGAGGRAVLPGRFRGSTWLGDGGYAGRRRDLVAGALMLRFAGMRGPEPSRCGGACPLGAELLHNFRGPARLLRGEAEQRPVGPAVGWAGIPGSFAIASGAAGTSELLGPRPCVRGRSVQRRVVVRRRSTGPLLVRCAVGVACLCVLSPFHSSNSGLGFCFFWSRSGPRSAFLPHVDERLEAVVTSSALRGAPGAGRDGGGSAPSVLQRKTSWLRVVRNQGER